MAKRLLVRVPHEELNIPKLVNHLENDVVLVYFRKKTTGKFRSIYPFTRNIKFIPFSETQRVLNLRDEPISNIQKNLGALIKGFSLLENSWKSFYTNNVLYYEVYDMEGDTL